MNNTLKGVMYVVIILFFIVVIYVLFNKVDEQKEVEKVLNSATPPPTTIDPDTGNVRIVPVSSDSEQAKQAIEKQLKLMLNNPAFMKKVYAELGINKKDALLQGQPTGWTLKPTGYVDAMVNDNGYTYETWPVPIPYLFPAFPEKVAQFQALTLFAEPNSGSNLNYERYKQAADFPVEGFDLSPATLDGYLPSGMFGTPYRSEQREGKYPIRFERWQQATGWFLNNILTLARTLNDYLVLTAIQQLKDAGWQFTNA